MNGLIEQRERANLREVALEFSERSKQVLMTAIDESKLIGEGYIDTSHLLLGLTQVYPLSQVFEKAGISPERIKQTRDQIAGFEYGRLLRVSEIDDQDTAIERVRLLKTVRMHKIAVMLQKRAKSGNRKVVEPEDMLSAIIDERFGLGARILQRMKVDTKKLLEEIKIGNGTNI